ncbi:MAG: tetratricopeptide repeat protein [Lysobacter sp.]|nr:tetratricopeptide repeat protein [Lysobacter sp.]
MSEATASLDTALNHASQLLGSDPELAGQQATEILRVVADHPVALMILGISHRLCGRQERAIELLAPLSRTQAGMPRVHYEYAMALARTGRVEEAIATLQRALSLNPALPQVWLSLADLQRAVGRQKDADEAYAGYIRYSVRDPNLLQAAEALNANRLPEAEGMLRAWLKQHPTDVVAIRMLGELAVRVGRNPEALRLFERCLQLAPGFREARQHFAVVLHREQQSSKALEQLELLLREDPANAGARTLKAAVLCRLGEYARGIELYEGLLREYPHNARVWLSYGHALKTEGRQADAIAAYRHCVEEEPEFGEAWWSLANLKTIRFDDADIATMRAQLQRDDLETEHRLHFEFSLGKALEDRADYAESFAHYAEGNRLRLEIVPYRAGDTTARVVHAKRVYTREFFAEREGCGDPAPDPIFIVGLPRSGSTLIEQILSSHSAVEGTMELPEIIAMTRALRRGSEGAASYHDVLAGLPVEQFAELGRQFIDRTRVQRKTGAPLFIDKMPNNFLHLGLIQLMLPNAKIIDARRHPLACCFSGFKQHFARGQSFSYSLDDLGRYYRDYVDLMAHFDAVLPGRVHRVIYERMVEDTEAEVRRLLDYCGLPFEERCLRFFENDRPVRTASSEQVRRPINRDGIDQWRHYSTWLDPLRTALGPVLDAYPDVPEFLGEA